MSRAVEAAGDDPAARRDAAVAKYSERMKKPGHDARDLGRAMLDEALRALDE